MGTDEWGIDDGWWSADGQWHDANPDTVVAIRDQMARTPPDGLPTVPMWFVRTGSTPELLGAALIETERGEEIAVSDRLPGDLPVGIHQLRPRDGGPVTRLVVTPGVTAGLGARRWGVVAQLYSCRSVRSQGIGDFSDLATIGRWLASRSGQVLGLNPLGAPLNTSPRQASPYSPSTRRFLDPIYLDITAIPGASAAAPRRTDLTDLIDRDAVWADKLTALEAAFVAADSPRVTGDADYARFCTLVERFGCGWTGWPPEFADPTSAAVADETARRPDRLAFWTWVTAQCDAQFDTARSELDHLGITTIGDLTVGVDRSGFDAWMNARCLARGMAIGAPPDIFNPTGQNWALSPFDPWALRAAGYAPFIDTLQATFARFGGLRIDHVMGLFRLYWIPEGAGPADGAYVRYPADELLDLVALEAARVGGIVVGEDLGTVEDGVRENLWNRRIAGTRVGWFDPHPSTWPDQSVGTLTTHDLPTVVGALSGADPTADPRLVEGLHNSLDHDPATPTEELLIEAHRQLGAAGSTIVLATMEDVVGSPHRVNQPGVNDYPSWRTPLGVSLDDLPDDETAIAVTNAIAAGRQG